MADIKKGIFFDAADTLFEVKEGVGAQYSRIARKYGVTVEAAFLNRRFKEVFKNSPPLAFAAVPASEIEALEKRWWYDLVQAVFSPIPFPRFDDFFDEVYAFFAGEEGWSLFPETMTVLERLKKGGYHLGIISNFDSRIEPVCRSLKIRHFFHTMTISSRSGIAKPLPGIFEMALKEAQVAPSDAFYIGDSPDHDIEGALTVGMTPFLVDRAGRYVDQTRLIRLPDLSGIFQYLPS